MTGPGAPDAPGRPDAPELLPLVSMSVMSSGTSGAGEPKGARTRGARRAALAAGLALAALAGSLLLPGRPSHGAGPSDASAPVRTAAAERRDFVRTLRIAGTVEAIRSSVITAPRLAGPGSNTLVITRLVGSGTSVRAGDVLVEFDRQEQLKNALDRRAELRDFEEQIARTRAEQDAARMADDTELVRARHDVERARLEMLKNEFLARIEVEKNEQALEEAEAKLAQLEETYLLKREAAAAEIRILEIRRDRAALAMRNAESNAARMAIASPLDGLAVLKTIWKGGQMGEVQEGEEIRAGVPVVEVVDPSAMQVRARVNQVDVHRLATGQPARIHLDAYDELSLAGRITQVAPLGTPSTLHPKVRTFIVTIAVEGSDPRLMPDLSAAVDVEILRVPDALLVPRDAIVDGGGTPRVRVRAGSGFEARTVTLGPVGDHEAVVESGIAEGAVVARHAAVEAQR